ncbi:class I SAM-dependent methyltransferase [Dictyobacter kobayashii]|uniref:SAM-dependent methyltransferase n=1 Tax=Dictyobacter kobayashii TaxID=2014872 RepID=A0A402AYP8_9CHLR|nr:class I SAM-dependent methyltransferase [Dictyobacter kobayashii]GCE24193.1 SAM-dependent methyltransferase [Dictyobacter kobayashii]
MSKPHIDTETVRADFDRIALLAPESEHGRWNHNNHYHPFLLAQLPAQCDHALDLGCGTGDFARLLAARSKHVLAMDLSPQMIQRARMQSSASPNIEFVAADALLWDFQPGQFDYVSSIATLHHIPLEEILIRMKEALAPGGTLAVLDLYAHRPSDLFIDLAAIPINLVMERIKNGHRPPGSQAAREAMAAHYAHDSHLWMMPLAQIRHICHKILPGARVTRHLYWRYSIVWQKPSDAPRQK